MPENEPETQKTPKGYEIPVPKRDDVHRMFDKSAQPIDEPKKKHKKK